MIALPLALALGIASIPAGVSTPLSPPAMGIITAIIAGLIVSLFGGSRLQIAGPTAAFIPLILMIVSEHGYYGLLVATVMAGLILILMGLTKMGDLIKFIPWPVTSGFTTGIAIVVMLTQVPDFVGLATTDSMPREFLEKFPWLGRVVSGFNPYALGLAVVCTAFLLLWRKFGSRHIPSSLVVILLAGLFVSWSGWGETHAVATIGSKFGPTALPSGLPQPHGLSINWELIRSLIGPATAIALLGAIESLLSAVVADGLSGDRHNSNTELIAQGIANIICPFFGGLPATGAIARTSANISHGGKTPIAGTVHVLTLLAVILVAAPLAAKIPMAAISAILVVVALKMGQWNELARVRRMPRSDALVMLTTFSLAVIFDLVVAVEVGMVLAAILFVKRVSETTEVSIVTPDDSLESPEQIAHGKILPPGTCAYRIFGPFLFGAAEKLEDALNRLNEWPKILILRLHLVTAMDATGLNVLESIVERLRAHQGVVLLSGIHLQPLQMIRKAGFLEVIGQENVLATFDEAIARAEQITGKMGLPTD